MSEPQELHPKNSRDQAPVLPLADAAVLPGSTAVLRLSTASLRGSVPFEPAAETMLAFVGAAGQDPGHPVLAPLPRPAVLARVLRTQGPVNGSVQLTVQGIRRVQIVAWAQDLPYRVGVLGPVVEVAAEQSVTQPHVARVLELTQSLVQLDAGYPDSLLEAFRLHTAEPGRFADIVASSLRLSLPEKFAIAECRDIAERLRSLEEFLEAHLADVSNRWTQATRGIATLPASDPWLDPLGTPTISPKRPRVDEADELLERLGTAQVPSHVLAAVRRDIEKLRYLGPGSTEHSDLRSHIDWILGLPWSPPPERNFDLEHVERVLDEEHFGQAKAKERILEYLAVLRLRRDAPSPILCLVGPPGTGKSNLARGVARALGREFVRISVAGVSDEAEIRGRRRARTAARPGMILEALRNVGCADAVFVVDDIDKLGSDGHSTHPLGALLDVVDPERNHAFHDQYLELPYDLSHLLFILTANVLEMVPDALVDRLEVIEIPGYTDTEKQQIVGNYVLPRALERHGLAPADLTISPQAVMRLTREYALEAGLRQLQRQVESICRKCARRFARGDVGPWRVTADNIEELLGPPIHIPEVAERAPEVGVATGLAWTPVGGDLLTIETIRMPGGGRMIATGQLGEVMRESVQAAFSLVRTRADYLGIPLESFADVDIHVHFPAGAIPKDGPSAGITITLALGSLFSNRPVRHDVATTGEVSIRGKVLPVGGIREKVMAAHRTGIRTVILPKSNLKNLADVPDSVRAEIEFIGVETMDEVFAHALLDPEEAAAVEPVVVARKATRRRARRAEPESKAAKQARGRRTRR